MTTRSGKNIADAGLSLGESLVRAGLDRSTAKAKAKAKARAKVNGNSKAGTKGKANPQRAA